MVRQELQAPDVSVGLETAAQAVRLSWDYVEEVWWCGGGRHSDVTLVIGKGDAIWRQGLVGGGGGGGGGGGRGGQKGEGVCRGRRGQSAREVFT